MLRIMVETLPSESHIGILAGFTQERALEIEKILTSTESFEEVRPFFAHYGAPIIGVKQRYEGADAFVSHASVVLFDRSKPTWSFPKVFAREYPSSTIIAYMPGRGWIDVEPKMDLSRAERVQLAGRNPTFVYNVIQIGQDHFNIDRRYHAESDALGLLHELVHTVYWALDNRNQKPDKVTTLWSPLNERKLPIVVEGNFLTDKERSALQEWAGRNSLNVYSIITLYRSLKSEIAAIKLEGYEASKFNFRMIAPQLHDFYRRMVAAQTPQEAFDVLMTQEPYRSIYRYIEVRDDWSYMGARKKPPLPWGELPLDSILPVEHIRPELKSMFSGMFNLP